MATQPDHLKRLSTKRTDLADSPSKRVKLSSAEDLKNTPTNLPELSRLEEDGEESNSGKPGKETFLGDYNSGSYMGPSHAEDPYLNRYLGIDPEMGMFPFVTRATRVVEKDTAFTLYSRECECDESLQAMYDAKWEQLNQQVAPYRDQLLALYFRFIDWTYPAVDKKRFYRAYFENDPPLHRGLLSAMLGLGVTYWKYSTQLCVKPIPPNLATNLWKMSLYYIEHDVTCKGASLDTVQALLLYIQKRLAGDGMHEQIMTRIQIGMLVSMAYSLGLHLDCSQWDIDEVEKSSRRRLWALVYYVDKWTSANLGHPSLLGGSNVGHAPLKFESKHRQERRFVHLIELTNILSEVLNKLYHNSEVTLPKPPHSFASEHAKRAVFVERDKLSAVSDSLLASLRNWWAALPEDLKDMKARNSLNYCSNGMLHLAALNVEVLIFRYLLLPHHGGRYRHEARDLVQRIIIFCLEITHSHLHAFWISSCCLSLSSLTHFVLRYHAQSPPRERKKNTPLMRSWLECLRSLNHGWEEGIGLAYHRMDILFYKGKTHLELPISEECLVPDAAKHENSTHYNEMPTGRFDVFGEEPLGLDDDFIAQDVGRSPQQLLFTDEPLRDILQDFLWD